jgi:hypothetical protein
MERMKAPRVPDVPVPVQASDQLGLSFVCGEPRFSPVISEVDSNEQPEHKQDSDDNQGD